MDNIYLMIDGEKNHIIANVYDIVPASFWKEEIINGYLRKIQMDFQIFADKGIGENREFGDHLFHGPFFGGVFV